jgi:opacity protein-like surface antigen
MFKTLIIFKPNHMKKIVLLLAIIAIGTSSFAQDVKYGVKGGLNIANLGGDDPEGDAKASFYLGGFVTFQLSENFEFQPELIYSQQGSKIKEGDYEEKFKANYLNIPLLFKAKMFGSEHLKAVAGPQIGILVNSELSAEGPLGDEDMDFKKMMKDLDFALGLGLEYDFDDKLTLSARYNWGLSKIFDQDMVGSDAKNSVFQIGLSFSF